MSQKLERLVRRLALLVMLLVVSACAAGKVVTATLPEPTMTPSQLAEDQPTATQPVRTIATLLAIASSATAEAILSATVTPSPTAKVTTVITGDLVQVEVGDNFIDPFVLSITAGTTVEWLPIGQNTHTITTVNNQQGWSQDSILRGRGSPSVLKTFKEPGVYQYYCTIHLNTMDGLIIVTEDDSNSNRR